MSLKRPLLLPLVPLYAAGLACKRRFGPRPLTLRHPVVSIGSLSAGGAGKTPMVEALARLLLDAGYAVDILSRGYGRAAQTIEQVDPTGSAARFGDEPVMLARSTGVPVYVGADRHAAGSLAEQTAPPHLVHILVHILDDGLQHRRLARQLDIVLFTAEDAADTLLPAGNLREPLTRLRKAGAIVLREEEAAALRPLVVRLGGAATPIWIVRRLLALPAVQSSRWLAFCGIARPHGFFAMLRAQGVTVVREATFRDHHHYTPRDIDRLIALAHAAPAIGFVTTEKDAVKLAPALQARLQAAGKFAVARLNVEILGPVAVLRQLIDAIGPPPA